MRPIVPTTKQHCQADASKSCLPRLPEDVANGVHHDAAQGRLAGGLQQAGHPLQVVQQVEACVYAALDVDVVQHGWGVWAPADLAMS